MELITLADVGVRYDENVALEHVNLKIYSTDFLGVIGPNGGGKTTLVKTIMDVVDYEGEIAYSTLLEGPAGRRIGYLPQINNFDNKFPVSVREVALSGLQQKKGITRSYRAADKQKANELLEMLGIGNIAGRPIGEISGGQMQRTLLCRSLISDPLLLILDEPANFVDDRFEKELYQLLHELNTHMAIIMVSHDLSTIKDIVKDVVCVNKHVHRHESGSMTPEQLSNYGCPHS